MEEWFMNLDGTMKVFWCCTIVASAVFLLQALLTFAGIDSTDGLDADIDIADGDTMDTGGALSLFSFRSMVNFLVGFGWAGVSLRSVIESDALLYAAAVGVGLVFGYIYVFLRKKLMRLETNGAYNTADCLGKEADVYLRIPASGSGKGKVQVSINGSIHEFDALTDGEEIATGGRVKIVSVDGSVMKVERV